MRLIVFIVFSAIGVAAMGASALCEDLIQYYDNRRGLGQGQETVNRLKSLNADYDVLLERLETDPAFVRRIAPVTLGVAHEDPNAIYPTARISELAAARKALVDQTEQPHRDPPPPAWLQRCSEPRRRLVLFVAGAGLLLVASTFFTSAPKPSRQKS